MKNKYKKLYKAYFKYFNGISYAVINPSNLNPHNNLNNIIIHNNDILIRTKKVLVGFKTYLFLHIKSGCFVRMHVDDVVKCENKKI